MRRKEKYSNGGCRFLDYFHVYSSVLTKDYFYTDWKQWLEWQAGKGNQIIGSSHVNLQSFFLSVFCDLSCTNLFLTLCSYLVGIFNCFLFLTQEETTRGLSRSLKLWGSCGGEEGPGPRALALPPATYCALHTEGTIITCGGEEGPGPRALALPPATYCALHTEGTITTFEERGVQRRYIFKLLRSPGIDSKELIPPANAAWRVGTTTLIPARFLAPIDCSKIRALEPGPRNHHQQHILRFMQHSSSSTYCRWDWEEDSYFGLWW